MANKHASRLMISKLWRITLYVLIVTAPLLLRTLLSDDTDSLLLVRVANGLALLGFAMLAMQFVLSARFKWIEKPFGLDKIFVFHKLMAIVTVILLLLHPVLLAMGEYGIGLFFSMEQPWPIMAGKGALVLLCLLACISMFRRVLAIEYQLWKRLHNIFALVVLLAGFTHAIIIGPDMQISAVFRVQIVLVFLAVISYLLHRVWMQANVRRHAYSVVAVTKECDKVWTIKLAPPQGKKILGYTPGQFSFITLLRKVKPYKEEHHFTIASSPTDLKTVSMTIKESGDYTATIGKTVVGDMAMLEGAFGRFSYVNYINLEHLVFVAGGIGITPFMSMLRYMRDSGSKQKVMLIYCNREENDIAFKDELEKMTNDKDVLMDLIHIVNRPKESWKGENGLIDKKKLQRLCGSNMKTSTFYICAPLPMIAAVTKDLKSLGVSQSEIHTERFLL